MFYQHLAFIHFELFDILPLIIVNIFTVKLFHEDGDKDTPEDCYFEHQKELNLFKVC